MASRFFAWLFSPIRWLNHVFLGWFIGLLRTQAIADLEFIVTEKDREISGLKVELRIAQEEIKVRETAMKGHADVLAWYEKKIEAYTALEASQIALSNEIVRRQIIRREKEGAR